MINNYFRGTQYFWRGLKLLNKPGIRRFVILPFLINCLLFIAAISFGVQYFSEFLSWLLPDLPFWLQWLAWPLWILFSITALIFVFFTFSLLANIVGAPFNSLLAEAIETHLTGKIMSEESSWQKFLSNVIPSIINELKKLVYFLVLTLLVTLLFFIPVINIGAPFLWFIVTAWMLCLEYTDYPSGNHGMNFLELRKILKQHKFLCFGFGSLATLATMVPLGNFLVMPTAVAGATVLWVEKLRPNSNGT